VLVSKVIQNLANGVKFGSKESFLVPTNDFLDQSTPPLSRYLNAIVSLPSPLIMAPVTVPASMVEESMVRLTSILENTLSKIGEVLGNSSASEVSFPLKNKKTKNKKNTQFTFLLLRLKIFLEPGGDTLNV